MFIFQVKSKNLYKYRLAGDINYRMRSIFLFLILIFISTFAKANIIRDSELEESINLIATPVIKAANLTNVKIYIINNSDLNAFTAGGNEIYINSGLINQFADIDVIRGVIAHEIGHILGKHIIRQLENIDIYNKVALSSVAIGLASAATGNSSLASAIAFGGMHFSERSILSHSRAFESSADQTALKLLQQSGNSSIGMIKFFEYMKVQHSSRFVNPYDQTHPLSQERLVVLRDFYQKSNFKNSQNSKELEYKFARSTAKLIAFTTTTPKKLLTQATAYPPEILNYIKAICYFRMSDLNNSMQYINKLLVLHPNDPFYHELKGQILFEFGKKEALDSYIIASNLKPNDLLIKLGKAIVGITVYSDQPAKMHQFYQDLKLVSAKEPDNIFALYYLSIYYEKVGRSAESLLSSAIIAYKTGDLDRAKGLARVAIKKLKQGTPDWYKAQDIILTEK